MNVWRKAAVLSSGVMLSFSLAGFNSANADWTDPNGGALVDSEQLLTTSVPTQLWCTWYLNGVGNISLHPPVVGTVDGEPVYAEYEGVEMLLSASQPQEILLAGWTETGTPTVAERLDGDDEYDCDWYLNGIGITTSVTSDTDTTGFSASASISGRDDAMGWSLVAAPMKATYSADPSFGAESCLGWTSISPIHYFDGDSRLGGETLVRNGLDVGTADYCAFIGLYEVMMPGGKMPSFAGQNYTFTGPTLTTRVVFTLD
jgi:hypothetical protein